MDRIRLGVVMDPIRGIKPAKDSTLAMLLEAERRGHEILYMEQGSLRIRNGVAQAEARQLRVHDDATTWFQLGPPLDIGLKDLNVILMRKDPPFDTEYIYTTYILDQAEQAGALVVNKPQALRDINEKAFIAWFPQCCPDTVIARSLAVLRAFAAEHGTIVVKPLDGMGGRSVFVLRTDDLNTNVILETMTHYETRHIMAQRYVPEIREGDKRVLLVNGQPVRYVLARVPSATDNRGNLVAGAQPEVRELTERDHWICQQVGPVLKQRGVLFAGLDIIGDYLTEINVTSPTGIRELKKLASIDAAAQFLDAVESSLGAHQPRH